MSMYIEVYTIVSITYYVINEILMIRNDNLKIGTE